MMLLRSLSSGLFSRLGSRYSTALSVLLFAALSLAPFFWTTAGDIYSYIGGADYLSPINILTSFYYSIFPFNHLNTAGVDTAFLLAATPLNFFYFLLNWLGATPLFATIVLLSLIIFVAQLSFFICLRYFMMRKLHLQSTVACTLGAILYGFSPYVIALIIPGHIMTLIIFAPFPLIIRYLDALLTNLKLDATATIILFFIFTICAPGFGNIGIIYVFLIACGLYFISILIAERLCIGRSILRFSLFVALIFLANSWWLAPHLYNISYYIAMSESSYSGMLHMVAHASSHASIANLFQGKPENLMYMIDIVGNNYYVNAFMSTIFFAVSLFFVLTSFNKQRQIFVLLFAALASVMFVKGVQDPFPDLFLWAYDNVPGFQIFRRPVAKFNGFFLFFYLAVATLGLAILEEKLAHIKWLRHTLLGVTVVAAGYLVFIFSQTSSLLPFNIPNMYLKANDYLLADQVERVQIVPGTFGANPTYRRAMNSYNGMDFINEVFRFPKISPDSTTNSLNEPYKKITNELMQNIRESSSICTTSRALGLSHIIVRDDLERSQLEDSPDRIISILDRHPDIAQKTTFKGGSHAQLVVYKLRAECTAKLLNLDGTYTSLQYDYINPGKIVVNIEGLRGSAKLSFLNNFSKNWTIFSGQAEARTEANEPRQRASVAGMYNASGSLRASFDELLYAFRASPFENSHALFGQYANVWTLDPSLSKEKSDVTNNHLNSDGSVDLKLVLYYRPQAYFYLGIVVSLVTLLSLLLYRFKVALIRLLIHV